MLSWLRALLHTIDRRGRGREAPKQTTHITGTYQFWNCVFLLIGTIVPVETFSFVGAFICLFHESLDLAGLEGC